MMYAVVLAPVLLGVWLGRRVDAELEFFGNVRARFAATAVAALIAVAVVVALTALGNGRRGRPALGRRPAPLAVRRGAHRRGRRWRAALLAACSCCASAAASGAGAAATPDAAEDRRPGDAGHRRD